LNVVYISALSMMLSGNKVTLITDSNFLQIGTLYSNLRTVKELKKSYKIIHIL